MSAVQRAEQICGTRPSSDATAACPVPIDRGGRNALTISVGRCIGRVRVRCAMVSL